MFKNYISKIKFIELIIAFITFSSTVAAQKIRETKSKTYFLTKSINFDEKSELVDLKNENHPLQKEEFKITPPDSLPATKKELRKARRRAMNKFYTFGSGISTAYIKDYQVSPLTYNGIGSVLAIGTLYRLPDKIIKTEVLTGIVPLNNSKALKNNEKSFNLNTFRLNGGVYYLSNKLSPSYFKTYLGWSYNGVFNFRVNPRVMNSALGYDLLVNGAVGFRLERDISWKAKDQIHFLFFKFKRNERTVRFAWQFDLPVANVVTRPNYTAVPNFINKNNGENLGNIKFASFNEMYALSSQLELYYFLRNKNNILKLNYTWQTFSYYNKFYKVKDIFSGVYLSFIFKLDNNPNY